MTRFTSSQPPLKYPTDLTLWEWLFEPSLSTASPLGKAGTGLLGGQGGYVDAVTKESLPFDLVRQHATRLSQALHHTYGIRAGDTVTLFSTNTIWYPVAMWAVSRLGGRVNGASPAYTAEEMVHVLRTAKTKLVFTLSHAVGLVRQAAEEAGLGRDRVLVLDGGGSSETRQRQEGVASLQDLLHDDDGSETRQRQEGVASLQDLLHDDDGSETRQRQEGVASLQDLLHDDDGSETRQRQEGVASLQDLLHDDDGSETRQRQEGVASLQDLLHDDDGSETRQRQEGVVSLQDLLHNDDDDGVVAVPHWRIPQGTTNRDVCGFLNFSSGTTGLPKAVMLSHQNVIAQCMQLNQLQVMPEDGKRYSILAVMPLFHITGLVRFCTYPVLMNGYTYMLPRYTLEGMLEAICAYKIEELILVPPILIRLVRDHETVDQFDLSHVKRWSSGSAPIAPEVIKALQAKFPWTGFRQGYGATESTACITCHPPTHFDYKYAASGGKLVANTEAKVLSLDGDRRELGVGETGEICARGPQIAMGYLDNEEATRETFQDGWLHTGDVGHFNEEGLVYVEDRIKEMIKVKGLQVPPAELEDLLLGHEMVEDCAVTGVKDEWAGERPKAFVVLKRGFAKDERNGRELLEFVKEKKVRYKWLVEVEFVDEVPKNPTGKLLRRVLKLREREGRHVGLRVREGQKARL
ncbi:hypothetical protein DV735_g4172, partial [Chaetothyriales sp. CBS 134920]